MVAFLWLFQALLCLTVTGFRVVPRRNLNLFDANNTVGIYLASELFVDQPNRITIHSLKPIRKVMINMTSHRLKSYDIGLTTFNRPNAIKWSGVHGYSYNLKYAVPIELRPGASVSLNITYHYCIDKSCKGSKKLVVKSVERSVRMVSRYVHILGETDKPMYRPGDTVRFRFIALTTRSILPTAKYPIWPSYEAVGELWGDKELTKLDPELQKRRALVPFFDSIELKDPLNNVVQHWKEANELDALDLSYRLLSDATEGKWTIVARVREESDELSFRVRQYILPRFQAHISMQKEIEPEDINMTFGICAAYTNGPAMPGTFDAQICVCSQAELDRQQELRQMMPGNECKINYGLEVRRCMRFNGILDHTSCTNVTANISTLTKGKPPRWNEKLGVFVEVSEEATGSSIVLSSTAEFKMWSDPKLELKMLGSFRPGFPVVGQVLYKNNLDATGDLELIVREETDPCGGWMPSTTRSPIRLKRIITTTYGQETYKFSLPPFEFDNSASILVRQIEKINGSKESGSPVINEGGFRPYWFPGPRPRWDLQTSKRLKLWDNNRDLAIQIDVLNETQISCPGMVHLQVFANERLPDNATLMLHFLSRGQFATRVLRLQPDYECRAQNNEFGHYECRKDGEISCLTGWTGSNCLTPLCTNDCGSGGICVAPGQCACKPGWEGPSCEICVPRNGCKNGHCEEGGDCVCNTGFSGYLCDRAVVNFEEVNGNIEKETSNKFINKEFTLRNTTAVENIPRRSVFKHVADLELNSDFGPEFRAVAFVLIDGRMATDYVQIKNIQSCSSPVLAETSRSQETLKFSKAVAVPGEAVNVSLKLASRVIGGSNITNKCLLSMVDVATRNFDAIGNRRIDFEAFIEIFKANRGMDDPSWISGSDDAYQAAGIDFTLSIPKEVLIKPIIVCPLYYARAMHFDGSPASGSVENSVGESSAALHKPRIRDFLPEVWLFRPTELTNGSIDMHLKAPDSLTSWVANAVCFMGDRGLWMPVVKPTLTVRLPFFVDFTPPLMARRGEIIHLPITIFLQPNEESINRTCFEVEVSIASDPQHWRIVGASSFSACMCSSEGGQQTKETFRLPMRPLRIGQLNLTAIAIARYGSVVCNDRSNDVPKEIVTASDAIRRSIRVVSEGIEKRSTIGGTFCSYETSNSYHDLKLGLSDEGIAADSLRSYISVSGNVIGRALANLDSLIQMPTGCGEQNLVKVAPSVYVLKYLLSRQSVADLAKNALARKAAGYIVRGFENQLKYRHPSTGAFSTFGPGNGANGSTWLTAYVFGVFSEADKLPLSSISDQTLDAYSTLSNAFDFLVDQQQSDGCFIDTGSSFHSSLRNGHGVENKLQLTAHVLAAMSYACAPLKESKTVQFDKTIRAAIGCINSTTQLFPLRDWSTISIAQVLHSTKKLRSFTDISMQKAMLNELENRSKVDSTLSGFLKWWPDSESVTTINSYYQRVRALETTAYALLALSPDYISRQDQIAIMKWISQQQNENGGFFSSQDTVIALRALMENAGNLPPIIEPAFVSIISKEKSSVNINVEVNPDNQMVSRTFEIGSHNESDFTSFGVRIESAKPVCISVHVTSIYNVREPKKVEKIFSLDISVDQGGNSATALCTTAHTTICLRPARSQGTGMLLVTLLLPSGWTVTMSELDKIPLNKDLNKVEFDAAQQKVSAYLNGFENGVEKAEQCFTVQLHQRTYVQNLQAGLVTARDYYNPAEKVEEPLQLDSCQIYWEPLMGGFAENTSEILANTTTPTPAVDEPPKESSNCPKCVGVNTSVMNEYLIHSLCQHKRQFFVFKTSGKSELGSLRGLIYSFNYGNRLASWNTTVHLPEMCECNASSEGIFGIFGTDIRAGDLNLNLARGELITFNAVIEATPVFRKALETMLDDEKTEKKYRCYDHEALAFNALIKKLSPLNNTSPQ